MKTKAEDLWLDFLVNVKTRTDSGTSQVCGLCGNNGVVRLGRDKTPGGFELEQRIAYCICPNGQSIKRARQR